MTSFTFCDQFGFVPFFLYLLLLLMERNWRCSLTLERVNIDGVEENNITSFFRILTGATERNGSVRLRGFDPECNAVRMKRQRGRRVLELPLGLRDTPRTVAKGWANRGMNRQSSSLWHELKWSLQLLDPLRTVSFQKFFSSDGSLLFSGFSPFSTHSPIRECGLWWIVNILKRLIKNHLGNSSLRIGMGVKTNSLRLSSGQI